MNIVILTHPAFFASQSMPRYARMLQEGLEERGHQVEVWTASEVFYKIPLWKKIRKWLGYLDQFVLFPWEFRSRLKKVSPDTLFVFADQALGPWVPIVAKKYSHVIHCHDFMAQRSALGEVAENKVPFTGKVYQKWIRNGYRAGKNFISVSQKTKNDLHSFLKTPPIVSEVVYNGLNQEFKPGDILGARIEIQANLKIDVSKGYILHVGGNQYYKNRKGVIGIYNAFRRQYPTEIPLLLIGAKPTRNLISLAEGSPYSSDFQFATRISDDLLKLAYQGASVLLFPSLDEGFGWPIAEAMASGCPVITTGKSPMTEVGGDSCFYIPPSPPGEDEFEKWSARTAPVLNRVLQLSEEKRLKLREEGIRNAERFCPKSSMENMEKIYQTILHAYQKSSYNANASSNTVNGSSQWRPLPGDSQQYS